MFKYNKSLYEKEMTDFYKTLEINPYDNEITNKVRDLWEAQINDSMSSYQKKALLYK